MITLVCRGIHHPVSKTEPKVPLLKKPNLKDIMNAFGIWHGRFPHDDEANMIGKAGRFAKALALGMIRKDGRTPEVQHYWNVGFHMARVGFGAEAICKAILHDIGELMGNGLELVKNEFPKIVYSGVKLLTKPKMNKRGEWVFSTDSYFTLVKDRFKEFATDNSELYYEREKIYYRQLLGSKNWAVLMIKILDQWDILSSLEFLSDVSKERKLKILDTYVMGLATRLLTIEDAEIMVDLFLQWRDRLNPGAIAGHPSHPLVKLPPRNRMSSYENLLRLPLASAGYITIYGGNNGDEFFEVGLPVSPFQDSDKFKITREYMNYMKKMEIGELRAADSMVPEGVGAHEIILQIPGKLDQYMRFALESMFYDFIDSRIAKDSSSLRLI